MTFYSIVRLRDGGGRTGGRVVGTGSGCVQRRSGSSPAFGLGSGSARVWSVAVAAGEATAFRAVIGQEVTGWRMVAVRRLCRRRRRLEDRRTGRGGLKRLRAAEVQRSVRVPARVWSGLVWSVAVASGEATAFRAVIGLEVTGRRMVAVCRLCRRRRRRKDWRTGCGYRERLRAAEVGSSPAFGRGSGSGLGCGSVPNCRTAGKRLRDARSKAGWRR